MEIFRIGGPARLTGEVRVVGAKNSVLKLMAAALLAQGRTVIENVPRIVDVAIMSELLRRLGCQVSVLPSGASASRSASSGATASVSAAPSSEMISGPESSADTVVIEVPAELGTEADYDLVRQLRASIAVLGPLLTRCGQVKVAMPGGDAIGSRGLDMHIAGLMRMGAEVTSEHGFVIAAADRLHGARVWLDFPSVGATENILTAAVMAKGTTVIDNAAREPEIVDICRMLTSMGAVIDGAGSSTLVVDGVDLLDSVTHHTVGDRIVAGTWAIAAAMTRGEVTINGADPDHLEIALDKLVTAGAEVSPHDQGFRVRMDGRPRSVDVVTLPYPGFATDLLAQAIALGAISDGSSMVTENVFDARFMFVNELTRLGASVRTDGHHAVVRGQEQLSGAPVRATDIRAGAALVLAGLCADGVTDVSDVFHIDRGYPDLVPQLRALGADVRRMSLPDPSFPSSPA